MSMIPSIPGASLFAAIRGTESFAPLRRPVYAALWATSLMSNFGSLIQSTAASWMMTSLTPSAYMVALVQTATALPVLLFSLPAGAIADIYNRRGVMLVSLAGLLISSALLTAAAYSGALSPWPLLALTFLIGSALALFGPAWSSSVAELVPREEMPAAVALTSLNYNVARALGPALGGLIVAGAGAAAAFLVNTLSYLGILTVLLRWKPQVATGTLPPEQVVPAVFSGLRYSRQSPGIRTVLLRSFLFGLAGSAIWALLPVISTELSGGPLTYGMLLGALGVGAIIGALTMTPARHQLGNERLVGVAVLVFALSATSMGVVRNLYVLGAAMAAAGVAWVWALSTFNMMVQMSVPRWVMGRTLSIYQMCTFGGIAGGSWVWGFLADGITPSGAMIASGGVMMLGLAMAARMPLPRYEELDLAPSGHWPEPATAFEVSHDSGPVRVTLEYKIKPANVRAFLHVMRRVRRMRRRDGAMIWSLLQDVAQPEIWLESFQLPTWADHLRQQVRATMADRAVEAAAFALHTGPARPRIRYLIDRQDQILDAARLARDVRRAESR